MKLENVDDDLKYRVLAVDSAEELERFLNEWFAKGYLLHSTQTVFDGDDCCLWFTAVMQKYGLLKDIQPWTKREELDDDPS